MARLIAKIDSREKSAIYIRLNQIFFVAEGSVPEFKMSTDSNARVEKFYIKYIILNNLQKTDSKILFPLFKR